MAFDQHVSSFLKKLGKEIPSDPVLLPHQQRLVDKMVNSNHGLVAYHGVGAGKTLSAITTAKRLGMPVDIVPPAALRENFKKELRKWDAKKQLTDVNILSQQAIANKGLPRTDKNRLELWDESHKLRDPKSKLHQQAAKSKGRKLLMTASGIYNHPADLASLINLAANKNVLPENPSEFEKKFVDYKKVNPSIIQRIMGLKPGEKPVLHVTPELEHALAKYVDYYNNGTDSPDYPSLKEEEKMVTMTPRQTELYNAIMGKAPMWVRMKVKAGLPPTKKELGDLKAFMTGPRQASNSTGAFYPNVPAESAKAEEAFSELQKRISEDPKYKAVVYSNYLNSGLHDYKNLLEAHGIPYGEFSGSIPDDERQTNVRNFNADKLRALLISSAGAEGLDLKGTRLVQLLEPHWNEEKERQIIGRARRYKSHEGLPPDKRNVLIQRFMARPRGSFLDRLVGGGETKGVDEYLRQIAKQKTDLNDQLLHVLQQQANPSILRKLLHH